MTRIHIKESDLYNTTDLGLASALCCHGYRIESMDRQNPSRAIFFIKRDEKLDDAVKSYFTHQMQVEPLMFTNYLKEIKNRIYNS